MPSPEWGTQSPEVDAISRVGCTVQRMMPFPEWGAQSRGGRHLQSGVPSAEVDAISRVGCPVQRWMPSLEWGAQCRGGCHLQSGVPSPEVDAISRVGCPVQRMMPFPEWGVQSRGGCHLQSGVPSIEVDAISISLQKRWMYCHGQLYSMWQSYMHVHYSMVVVLGIYKPKQYVSYKLCGGENMLGKIDVNLCKPP